MGAAVTCHAMAHVFDEKGVNAAGLSGVVLEAPFNNMVDELKVAVKDVNNIFLRCVAKAFSIMGGLSKMTKDYNIQFQSDHWLPRIQCPVLVLASEDDERIPSYLSETLVEKAREKGKNDVKLHKFKADEKLGHKYFYKSKNLSNVLRDFLDYLLK